MLAAADVDREDSEKRYMTKPTLLVVVAHPDDESFGPGGTIARYAQNGTDVHVVIATDGAAGSVVEGYEDARERLAEVRKEELEAAVAILGAELHKLGYRDSGYIGDPANEHPDAFMNIDEADGARKIVKLIREIRPQVVVTHDETGGYYHPDHIMTHKITKAAFHAAGDAEAFPEIGPAPYQPQKLYYTAIPGRWLKMMLWMIRLRGGDPTKMGRNNDIDFTKLGRPNNDLHAHINIYPYWETKRAASAKHQSQGGGGRMLSWMPVWLEKRLFSKEYFIRAYPPPRNGVQEVDLFAGVGVDG